MPAEKRGRHLSAFEVGGVDGAFGSGCPDSYDTTEAGGLLEEREEV